MTITDTTRYRVFTRTWWRHNPSWPNGLEPSAGTCNYRNHPRNLTYDEARRYCWRWNEEHPPGRLSRKAEFEQQ